MRQKNIPGAHPSLPAEGRDRAGSNKSHAFSRAHEQHAQQGAAGAKRIMNDEAVFRKVVYRVQDCVFLVDPESKDILFSNQALYRLLGKHPGSLYDFIGHDSESVRRSIERIVQGTAFRGERIFRKCDGTVVSMEVNASLISIGNENAICMVARDISGRNCVADRQSAERLEAILSMSKGIAHDSTNALFVIQSTIDLLMREVTEYIPSTRDRGYFSEQLSDIKTASDQLAFMISELRDMASRSLAPRDPAWISSVLKSKVFSAAQYGVGISFEIPKDTWAVEVSSNHIGRVFENLFRNASQAIAENKVEKGMILARASNVEVDAHFADPALKPGNYVLVSIADNGKGIVEKDLPRIFDMHFTTRKGKGGSGIGLTVCKMIIEEHGGRITAESDFGRGTVFRIYLPASEKKPPETERITGEYPPTRKP